MTQRGAQNYELWHAREADVPPPAGFCAIWRAPAMKPDRAVAWFYIKRPGPLISHEAPLLDMSVQSLVWLVLNTSFLVLLGREYKICELKLSARALSSESSPIKYRF